MASDFLIILVVSVLRLFLKYIVFAFVRRGLRLKTSLCRQGSLFQ
jgi:hypothetical protein